MMIYSYKDRTLDIGQTVEIYFNLHKKLFSIRDPKTKLVLAHGNNIVLKDPIFVVNEKERQKVIRDKRKNVHAFVKGEFIGLSENESFIKEIYYNPYEVSQFMVEDLTASVFKFEKVLFSNKKVYGSGGIV